MNVATVVDKGDGPILSMPCPRYGSCYPAPPLTRGPATDTGPRGREWNWAGTAETPTIRPSVNCHIKCGEHRVITNGSWT